MEIVATIKMNHFRDHGGRKEGRNGRGRVGITRATQRTCRFGESRSFSHFTPDIRKLVTGYLCQNLSKWEFCKPIVFLSREYESLN